MSNYKYLRTFFADLIKELNFVLPKWARTKSKSLVDVKRYMADFIDRKKMELWAKGFVSFQTKADKSDENKIIDQIVKDFSRWGDFIDRRIREEFKKGYKEDISQSELENRLKKEIANGGRYAFTWVNTGEGAVNRATILLSEIKSGTDYFKYTGPMNTDRKFCVVHFGKTYSLEKIQRLDNGQGLPVLYYCGGYNCRHRWRAVDNIEVFSNDKDLILSDKRMNKPYQKKKTWNKVIINGYTKRESTPLKSIHYDLNKSIINNIGDEFAESYERQLTKALRNSSKYEGTVYRGVMLNKEEIMRYEKTVGGTISEPMFLSASKAQGRIYPGNVVFKIISKTARDIEKLSDTPDDKEVLFDSHTAFKVLKIDKRNAIIVITMKEK